MRKHFLRAKGPGSSLKLNDLLRLAHPKAPSPQQDAVFRWMLNGADSLGEREVKFQNVEPCNQPVLLALDVSGSMAASNIAGSCLSAREASAAMALITAATEPEHEIITYTDSETWAGNIHPAQALREYRREFVGDVKAVVVGMTSNGFTLADPNDRGMLDVVGFDTSAPAVIGDFVRG